MPCHNTTDNFRHSDPYLVRSLDGHPGKPIDGTRNVAGSCVLNTFSYVLVILGFILVVLGFIVSIVFARYMGFAGILALVPGAFFGLIILVIVLVSLIHALREPAGV